MDAIFLSTTVAQSAELAQLAALSQYVTIAQSATIDQSAAIARSITIAQLIMAQFPAIAHSITIAQSDTIAQSVTAQSASKDDEGKKGDQLNVVLAICLLGAAAVLPTASAECGRFEKEFLLRYGYLDPMKNNTEKDIETAVTFFQWFTADYDINSTGQCDEATLELMRKPRCGCEDIVKPAPKVMPQNLNAPQQYNIGNTKWTKKLLTWTVRKYPVKNRQLSRAQVDDAMKRGLQIWADRTTLRFQQVSGNEADITISFEVRRHTATGPYYDFDGRSGVLAHAFFPQSGVVHFDDDEDFTLGNDKGTELYIVAAHEFGHTLGISHSNDKNALMAPYYRFSPKLELHRDDVNAVQAMYGRNTDTVTDRPTQRIIPTRAVTTPRRKDNAPKQCDMVINAAFKIGRTTYVFSREKVGRWRRITYVYKVDEYSGIDIDSRTPISDMFLSNPNSRSRYRPSPWRVDAATYIPNERRIYLFSGTRVYRYTVRNSRDKFYIDNDYPKWFSVGEFPERPRGAIAMKYTRSNNYYMMLVSETMIWQWDFYNERVGAMAYPLKVLGKLMPLRIDSAFSADGTSVYLVRDDSVYIFDLKRKRVLGKDSVKNVVNQFLKGPCL